VIAGAGIIAFGGGIHTTARTRAVLTAGLGGAASAGSNHFFLEVRFTRVLGPAPVARWLIPLRAGFRRVF